MEQVTIVVPFYNVEAYIGGCLDSLISQTHENIEILCIDDFSLDNSLAVVQAYAEKDHRIKVIKHDENKGRGGARNTGIKNTGSEYICFLDSDDYVSEKFVELLYQAITKDESDVVVCNMLCDEDGLISPYGTDYKNDSFAITSVKDNVLEVAILFNPGCTNKIYKHDLLIKNHIFQPEKCYYEDVIFWLMAVYHSQKVSSISDRLHYYRQRSDSVMNTLTYKHINDRFIFIRQIDAFVKDNILSKSNINTQKVLDDTQVYILRHLHYGKKLMDEAYLVNIMEMNEYYDNEVVRFSMDCNWLALPSAYKR